MTEYEVRPLTPQTWPAFEAFAGRHNGVFGGCWCMWFQRTSAEKAAQTDDNRTVKQRLVDQGRAHAALVFDGDEAIAWCEYGSPEELPNIYHRKEYDEAGDPPPDYRLTCIFVDNRHRHTGLARDALQGALELIAQAGGGVVEGYPHDTTDGRKVAVLYDGTRRMYEDAGFDYVRAKGQRNCVMQIVVPAAR
ncbi:MAG: GNAT family N-acetyltransferase [Nocardioides sp.]